MQHDYPNKSVKPEDVKTKVAKPESPLEEFYFSADGERPPVTILARSQEEAEREYAKKFNLSSTQS